MALILCLTFLIGSLDVRTASIDYADVKKNELIKVAQNGAKSYSVPVRIIEQPDTKTDADRLREQVSEEREAKDLAIQERMRDIAQNTFYFSIVQLLLTILGTGGLLYSLLLARHSTKAAVTAVQVTSQTARDQLRAYVLVDLSRIVFNAAGGASVIITFRNGGQTPALDMVIGCRMKTDEVNHPTPYPPPEFNPQMSRFSVLPDGSREKEVGPITPLQAGALVTGETIMSVWGEVRYRDIFDRHHYSRFHLVGGGTGGFRNGTALIVHGEGNVEGEYPA